MSELLGSILKRTLAEMEPRVEPRPGSPRAAMLAFYRGETPPPKEQPGREIIPPDLTTPFD